MSFGFIIMQVGNPALDEMCEKVFVPALGANGLEAKRVDKHNEGGLLKSEIIRFIEEAHIVIADLTNERPNCYLEIGYAMGLGKNRQLILTVREDHRLDSPSHQPGGPKVHFDLTGYDIIFWDPGDLDGFRVELEKRIRRRLAVARPSGGRGWDEDWIAEHRSKAQKALSELGLAGAVEVSAMLVDCEATATPAQLLEAARAAQIHTFGWPIAVIINSQEGYPKPISDGIVNEVVGRVGALFGEGASYDYWTIRRNGDFYLLHSYFEDKRTPPGTVLFFNTRIVRTTELLLYVARLYGQLGIPDSCEARVSLVHAGLKGRALRASSPDRSLPLESECREESIRTEIQVDLSKITDELPQFVKELLAPVFMLFGFHEFSDEVYEDIVDKFLQGKVT